MKNCNPIFSQQLDFNFLSATRLQFSVCNWVSILCLQLNSTFSSVTRFQFLVRNPSRLSCPRRHGLFSIILTLPQVSSLIDLVSSILFLYIESSSSSFSPSSSSAFLLIPPLFFSSGPHMRPSTSCTALPYVPLDTAVLFWWIFVGEWCSFPLLFLTRPMRELFFLFRP